MNDTIPNTGITVTAYATKLTELLAARVAADPSLHGITNWDDLCDRYDGLLDDTDAALGYDPNAAELADFDGYAAVVVAAVDSVVADRFPL